MFIWIIMKKRVLLFFGMAALAAAQTAPPVELSLKDAEAAALKNHPRVLAAENQLSAAHELITEARSAYLPTLNADLTGTQTNQDARVGAGLLTDPRMFDHFGQGVTFTQLVTDSGRTNNLVANTQLREKASQQDYQASKYDVLLAVNRAYYEVLRAQALVQVAEQTVAARQVLFDQVGELARNKLRSDLDVGFAEVNLEQAKLLVIRTENQLQSAFAELTRALGTDKPATYKLSDQPPPPGPEGQPDPLIAQAMANRPELASYRFSRDAAYKFERAERDLALPTVSITGVAGFLPLINQANARGNIPAEYEGISGNVEIPIFNGHLFAARLRAAGFEAHVADQKVRDAQEQIARDVQIAWNDSVTAFQRIGVTARLETEAARAQDLAKGRYDLGLSSIVELTQAELNLTSAQIENTNAKYDYQSQFAVLLYAQGLLR